MTEHLETMLLIVQQFKIFTNVIMSSGSMSTLIVKSKTTAHEIITRMHEEIQRH